MLDKNFLTFHNVNIKIFRLFKKFNLNFYTDNSILVFINFLHIYLIIFSVHCNTHCFCKLIKLLSSRIFKLHHLRFSIFLYFFIFENCHHVGIKKCFKSFYFLWTSYEPKFKKKTFIFFTESRIEKIDENENEKVNVDDDVDNINGQNDQIDKIVITNDFFEQLKQQIGVEKTRTNIANFFVDENFFYDDRRRIIVFFERMKSAEFDIQMSSDQLFFIINDQIYDKKFFDFKNKRRNHAKTFV